MRGRRQRRRGWWRQGRRGVRRALGVVLSVAVVVVVFAFVLPAVAHYEAVGHELGTLASAWIAVLAAAVLVNATTSALPWMVAVEGLGFVSALRITQASTAVITVLPGGAPAGMALTFAIARSRGVDGSDAGLAVALTGIWSQLATFVFPVVGLGLLAFTGPVSRPLAWTAVASLVALALAAVALAPALASESRARRLGDVVGPLIARAGRVVRRRVSEVGGEAWVRLRRRALAALRERGLALTLATLANQLTGFAILDLSLRAVGITLAEVSVAETFTAWSVARLIESLPLTPGGIGLVELGLVGTLAGFGAPHAPMVAGVLLYRGLVVVPTLVLGVLATATWRLGRDRSLQ